METIHLFKIAEDSQEFDVVEMIYDNLEEMYIVRWKWSYMKKFLMKKCKTKKEAIVTYNDRKRYAMLCK